MVRKVWFEEERPSVRIQREEEERIAIREREVAKVREEHNLRMAERRAAYARSRGSDPKYLQTLYDTFAVASPLLASYGMDPEHRGLSHWDILEPDQGYEYVLLGKNVSVDSKSSPPKAHVTFISPEVRRGAPYPGRDNIEQSVAIQKRITLVRQVALLPVEISRLLIEKLPLELSRYAGAVAVFPTGRDDPLRLYAVDTETLSHVVNAPESLNGWAGPSSPYRRFGMRRYFGAFEEPWRGTLS